LVQNSGYARSAIQDNGLLDAIAEEKFVEV
jgi:hypothetical protein